MKTRSKKRAKPPLPPVFPKMPPGLRLDTEAPTAPAAEKKRDNTFSKSRDIHEDRGERQMKTSHNPETIHHGK